MKKTPVQIQILLADGQSITRTVDDYGTYDLDLEVRSGVLVIETPGERTLEVFAPGYWTCGRRLG